MPMSGAQWTEAEHDSCPLCIPIYHPGHDSFGKPSKGGDRKTQRPPEAYS